MLILFSFWLHGDCVTKSCIPLFISGYAACRWALLSEADVHMVRERGWTGPLKDVGIAGMRNPQKVKCLHTMYAHWLAGMRRIINKFGRCASTLSTCIDRSHLLTNHVVFAFVVVSLAYSHLTIVVADFTSSIIEECRYFCFCFCFFSKY